MLLDVRDIASSYGLSQVLFGVSFSVGDGEVVTLMGRNGMGKTTTVRSLMGLLHPHAGEIRFRGERVDGLPPHRIARLGLGLVPEGRQIFPNLTVRENLVMAERRRGGAEPWTLERVFDMFPRLGERASNRGNHLSGGEQQMLAIGRALMTNPLLLVLDEATEGLAPKIREEIWAKLDELKKTGLAIIIIDKDVEALCAFADRHYILEKGEVIWTGSTADLAANKELQDRYLGV
ncbi:MAG: ABC transporter ATP-binding protein [Rhodoplanes sp.]|jgi:branched-chain amino acid transport system ATP-binding protein